MTGETKISFVKNYFKKLIDFNRNELAQMINFNERQLDYFLLNEFNKTFSSLRKEAIIKFVMNKIYSTEEICQKLNFSTKSNCMRILKKLETDLLEINA